MIILKFINWMNCKWNNIVFWIHDITTKWGMGHATVWFYDTFRWDLPTKWQLIGGRTYDEYMLEHELYLMRHQAQYYANLAYEYQWALIETTSDKEDCEVINELVYEEKDRYPIKS